jgi:hypothetical protein
MAPKTRADLEQVIIQGGSVMYQGRVITRVQDLPSEADLAAGDDAAEQTALGNLQAQIDKLTNERDRLQAQIDKRAPKAAKGEK